jgi:hypothetical protein
MLRSDNPQAGQNEAPSLTKLLHLGHTVSGISILSEGRPESAGGRTPSLPHAV